LIYNADSQDQVPHWPQQLRRDFYQVSLRSKPIPARKANSFRDTNHENDSFFTFSWVRTFSPGSCSPSRPSITTTARIIKAPCRTSPAPQPKTATRSTNGVQATFSWIRTAGQSSRWPLLPASLSRTANSLVCSATTLRNARTWTRLRDIARMRARSGLRRRAVKGDILAHLECRPSPNAFLRRRGRECQQPARSALPCGFPSYTGFSAPSTDISTRRRLC